MSASVNSASGYRLAPALQSAIINSAAGGDLVIVAAVAGQSVRVYRLILFAITASNITMKDGAGTSLTGAMTIGAGGSIQLPFDGEPWFTTTAGNSFIVNSSAAVQVSGRAYFVQQ